MNKKIISSILVIALLNLCGCYSSSALTKEETQNYHPDPNDSFIIVLKDGTEIVYDREDNPDAVFVRVDEPSDFIFGTGLIFDKYTQTNSRFGGKIDRNKIDSTKLVRTGNDVYHLFWLNDNTRITFGEGEYLDIKPEESIGYFISGKILLDKFLGKVEFGDIYEIRNDLIDVGKISLIIIGLGIFVYLMVSLINHQQEEGSGGLGFGFGF